MTTIAYRDGVMAADMAVRYGSIYGYAVHKIVRRDDGALCGTCGMTALGAGFRRWFLAGEVGERPSFGTRDGDEDMQAIIARPNGKVEVHDRLGWSEVAGSPYLAIGSGSDIALGAMAMGADAREAVEVAISFGVGRLGEVEWISIAEWDEEDLPAALEPAPDLSDAQKSQIDAANAEYVQATGQAVAVEIPEGFTRHDGGECPVPDGVAFDVIFDTFRSPDFDWHTILANDHVKAKELNWTGSRTFGARGVQHPVIAYRIVSQQPAAPLPPHQTDVETAPDAAQGDLNGIETTHYPPILTPEPQTYTTETGLTLAPGEVLPDPALHREHDGTGYWSGNVDGETP